MGDFPVDMDLMDELLFEGCWLETTDDFNLLKWGSPIHDTANFSPDNQQLQDTKDHPSISYTQESELKRELPGNSKAGGVGVLPAEAESNDLGRRWWFSPKTSLAPFPIKQRLVQAIQYLKECTKDKDVLIQIWVPVKSGGRHVLTTSNQPYTLGSSSQSLQSYRNVSENYQFPAEEDAKESFGMPGRVYLGKLPEWTPDVRFFKAEEYPRVNYAQQCDVRGSLALPVFERGSGTCLGVVEIVSTSQKINYQPELENVCRALEAVDLRSSQSFSTPGVKTCNQIYQAALPRVLEISTSTCKAYNLPLALTWASCLQQGKEGRRHSSQNYELCVSTVDSACFVSNQKYSGFLQACSEHHLFKGQGIVGRAFMTNKPCFAIDITAFSKTEYPLSHHARMFELQCAVAIPLVITSNESPDFVLEFFLPEDCKDADRQDQLLNSLANFVLQAFENSQMVSPTREENFKKEETVELANPVMRKGSLEKGLEVGNMIEFQSKGKGVSTWSDYHKMPKEEFSVVNEWGDSHLEIRQEFKSKPSSIAANDNALGGNDLVGGRKPGQNRRVKTEKTISLQVLRQYFAGSLKNAAQSLGVCPTTLKRICRQHGINRWPSRKIKKVGHSLRKLQLVMDSVHGAEGTIPISSFYKSFPELNYSTNESSDQLYPPENSTVQYGSTGLKSSASSSCSQSSGSSTSCSIGTKQDLTATNAGNSGDSLVFQDSTSILKRAQSDADLHISTRQEPNIIMRPETQLMLNKNPSFGSLSLPLKSSYPDSQERTTYRVKAVFGDEKIRFSLQPNWGFQDLLCEVAKRFGIDDVSGIDLKYLDDDREWVLLTCDADLEECLDVYRATQGRTIRIALHQVVHSNTRSSFGSM
ncbi:hypothetical protein SAY87_007282 [Trapa incisa]|uniref:Protein NLP2-like n=1 Tax=Trapa incisa TaxID=236973 RepID=A0AAN7JY71_9MYRT|nr:hypothetical protein SAY87_007282 [Trapa incisa]